mmetsp:Transcript_35802/g.67496  ORF Transcript_35802/g.67496 Transcript_35802/m.67496 type:complete len:118 (+) Transcript_35802:89-442(+)
MSSKTASVSRSKPSAELRDLLEGVAEKVRRPHLRRHATPVKWLMCGETECAELTSALDDASDVDVVSMEIGCYTHTRAPGWLCLNVVCSSSSCATQDTSIQRDKSKHETVLHMPVCG